VIKRFPSLRNVFADGGYASDKLRRALRKIGKWTIETIKRPPQTNGFQLFTRRVARA
jgi:putative transposase